MPRVHGVGSDRGSRLRRLQFFPGSVKLRESTGRAGGLPKGSYTVNLTPPKDPDVDSVPGMLHAEVAEVQKLRQYAKLEVAAAVDGLRISLRARSRRETRNLHIGGIELI